MDCPAAGETWIFIRALPTLNGIFMAFPARFSEDSGGVGMGRRLWRDAAPASSARNKSMQVEQRCSLFIHSTSGIPPAQSSASYPLPSPWLAWRGILVELLPATEPHKTISCECAPVGTSDPLISSTEYQPKTSLIRQPGDETDPIKAAASPSIRSCSFQGEAQPRVEI